ncbi:MULTISPECIES: helix-hairpin-helix domain-containing protein [Haloferacaceae]|uniref:Helix-hairpin-helix domain-containing protein n=1 Tax=Halorubrum glutamatedens TaxID=2707018 RepID=A0ABD5QSK5_9EURY|nr:helix-hairpin-helix domain-containing protein [Halobellus captivus]
MSSLEDLYGVGEVRAARLREHGLASVEEVANAPIDGLADLLDGVGRQRARQIRSSARRAVAEGDPDRRCRDRGSGREKPPKRPSGADGVYVTTRRVPAADAVVVVPGRAFLTRAGGTDHRRPWRRALVSVPGHALLESEAIDGTIVLCPPERAAATAPGLYGALAADAGSGSGREDDPDADIAPPASFLADVLRPGTLIPGDVVRDLYERRPELESELDAVLRNGTVLRRGESFDLEDAAQAELLASAGAYLPGERVLPEGAAFDAGSTVPGDELPESASFLSAGVVAVPGSRAIGRLAADVDDDPALPLLRSGGVLLPPDAVRER